MSQETFCVANQKGPQQKHCTQLPLQWNVQFKTYSVFKLNNDNDNHNDDDTLG